MKPVIKSEKQYAGVVTELLESIHKTIPSCEVVFNEIPYDDEDLTFDIILPKTLEDKREDFRNALIELVIQKEKQSGLKITAVFDVE